MKEPLYRDALKYGWKFTWKHPFLWVYGLFAAALGQFGMFDILSRIVSSVKDATGAEWQKGLDMSRFMFRNVGWTHGFQFQTDWVWLLWLAVVCVGFMVFFTFVAVVSQGALIYASAQGKSKMPIAADSREWHAGANHFWRLFFLQIFKKISIIIFGLIAGSAAYMVVVSSPSSVNLLFFLIMFLFAAFASITVSFFTIYAACYVVVEEAKLSKAFSLAWQLFSRHWLVSIEVGLLFFAFNILTAFVGILSFFALLALASLLWFFTVFIGNMVLSGAVMMFFFFCFLALVMFLGAVFTVFSTSVWTYLFMHMHSFGIKSRFLHWMS